MALAAHGVDGDDRPLDHQHVEERRNSDDLVGFFRHFDLPEHEALARRKGRNHVDRSLGTFFLIGAAHRLAVNRNHLSRGSGQRGHPRDEASLEFVGVERGKNVAELVV